MCSVALWRACGCIQVVIQREGKISALVIYLLIDFYHFYLKLYSLLAALGLCCCMQAFSSCGKLGLLSSYGTQASHLLWFLLLWNLALRHTGSIVVVCGFSCPKACGIFPGQGLNLCPLNWKWESQPLDCWGKVPPYYFLTLICLMGSEVSYSTNGC